AIVDDGSTDPAAFAPQVARVVLKSGAVVEARVDALLGSPAAPLSREAYLEKFRACMAYGRLDEARAEALIRRVDALESEEDFGALLALAGGGPT
ncbi:MAG: MmgE/PrpD family protein, partial [Parvularculaceae bacterium]|nr:MmgE/PrpD family protein [Parvularculaceae bacterium]